MRACQALALGASVPRCRVVTVLLSSGASCADTLGISATVQALATSTPGGQGVDAGHQHAGGQGVDAGHQHAGRARC